MIALILLLCIMMLFFDSLTSLKISPIVSTALFNSEVTKDNINQHKKSPDMSLHAKRIVASSSAPKAIGPYSQAVVSKGFVFTSGSIGLDPSTGKLAGDDISTQTRQALTNLQKILQEAGSDMSKVVKTTVLLTNISHYSAVNDIYAEFFSIDFPARSAYAVTSLPANALVEIEVIATL